LPSSPTRRSSDLRRLPMSIALPFIALLVASLAAAHFRASLKTWVIASAAALVVALLLKASIVASIAAALLLAVVAVPLLNESLRRSRITAPLLKLFAKALPRLSDTEQTALDAGTVGFEGELFSGLP